jgi:cell division protease FtsH
MAGRGAEKILLQGDYTQGAHGDLSSATQVATEMISRYGMGSRLVSMENFPGTIGADRIADEASTLITEASKKSDILLKKHRNLLETIANRLLDKETLDGAELRELADKHILGKLPKIKSRKAVGNIPAP